MRRFLGGAVLAIAVAGLCIVGEVLVGGRVALAQSEAGRPATLVVRVPVDAQVVVGGQTMRQRGGERRFVTPGLVPGYQYSYKVEARWTEAGKEVKTERTVAVEPGKTALVDFLAKEKIAPPKPAKKDTKAEPAKKDGMGEAPKKDGKGEPEKFLDKINQALPDKAPVQPKQPRRLLIYSKTAGFRHSSIPVGIKAITMMGDKTGAYTAVATEDESFFEPDKLKAFDAVLMLNTTNECLLPKFDTKDPEGEKKARAREEMLKKSLEDFVASGKGLAGTHSATDTYHNWKAFNQMMGGTFVSHPWHQKVPVKNLDPKHPINAAFGGADFEITDEIYMFRDDTARPGERRYLLALDNSKMTEKDAAKARKDGFLPVAWVATYGKGRNFYCSLGHREEIYWNPTILKHYLAGLQYAMGDLQADATPTGPAAK